MLTTGAGCDKGAAPAASSVVVYCSVDESVAAGILTDFGRRTGIAVRPIFDSEAGKTTGLVQRIIREAESGRPRADVFWSGEVFNTILLARMNLLEVYDSPAAADIPPRFKDPDHHWTGLAVRARVAAFDPARTAQSTLPTRWEAFGSAEFAGRLAMANPLFGTTRGHVAALFARWGEQRGRAFLQRLKDAGVHLCDGNSAAVRAVIDGRADWAWTDTDDVWVAQRRGASVDLIYPDLGDGGTLLIPCTVALVRGSPNGEVGRKLVDFLVSAEVERMLAKSEARYVPVRESLRDELGLAWPAESPVNFAAVADAMDEAEAAIRDILVR